MTRPAFVGPVAIVTGTWPPFKCGVGDYVARYAATIASRGVRTDIVTSRGAGRTIPAAALLHLPAARRAQARRNVRVWRVVGEWTATGIRPALDRLGALRPGLIHVQYPTLVYEQRLGINLLPARLRLGRPDLPVITTLHEFTQYRKLGRLRLAPNILLSRRVAVTSAEERAAVGRMFPSAGARVRVIPIASNIAVAGSRAAGRKLLRGLGMTGGDRVIMYFGWPGPGKGLPQLYDAIRALWDRGVPVKLVMVAARRTHPVFAALAKQARELEIMDLVKWTGFLPDADVSSLLLAAEACALPFEDGAKLNRGSLIAALTHGTPVVTTRGPALKELRGADVTPCDPTGDSIAAALHAVLRRPSSRRDRPRRPASSVRRFGWDAIADQYLNLYRDALTGR